MNDTFQTLEQEARRIEERMPTVINETTIAETRENLKRFLSDNKITQGMLSQRIGVSDGMISAFLDGKYKGDNEKLVRKVVNYMDTFARRQRHTRPAFVDTRVARRIFAAIKSVESLSSDDEAKIGMILGDAGHGKSVCLQQYAKANANSALVECDDTMTSTTLFSAIARAIKIDSSGAMKKLTERIKEKLQGRSLTFLLDEASGLTVRMLSQLRQVIVTQCRCPLILAANSNLRNTTSDLSMAKRGNESLDQFNSRLVCVLDLDAMATVGNNDGGSYSPEEIRELYQYKGLRLTNDAVRTLRTIARSPQCGRLRTCSHAIASLHASQKIRAKGEITGEDIRGVIEHLGLPVGPRLPFAKLEETEAVGEAAAEAKTA
jgi:hypothetical protein